MSQMHQILKNPESASDMVLGKNVNLRPAQRMFMMGFAIKQLDFDTFMVPNVDLSEILAILKQVLEDMNTSQRDITGLVFSIAEFFKSLEPVTEGHSAMVSKDTEVLDEFACKTVGLAVSALGEVEERQYSDHSSKFN